MFRPKFIHLVLVLFAAYAGHTGYTMYQLFNPEVCEISKASDHVCLKPFLRHEPKLELQVRITSHESAPTSKKNGPLLWRQKEFDITQPLEKALNLSIPASARARGELFAHVYVLLRGESVFANSWTVHASAKLTTLQVPAAKALNLLGQEQDLESEPSAPGEKKQHLRSKLHLSVMDSVIGLPRHSVPPEIHPLLRLSPEGEYLPVLYVNKLNNRIRELVLLNASDTQTLTISYSPISAGRLRLWVNMQHSMGSLQQLGFTEKDTDEVKGIFADTNFYLLMLTFAVSMFHLLFDFLAFKNDIFYWKNRKSMEGLSTRTVVWRCVSTFIVLLYLVDQQTSLLITIPTAVSAVIEMWKVKKAIRASLVWRGWRPSISLGAASEQERRTAQYDLEAMRGLSYLLYPLCLGGAGYSLLYVQHRSWYSWCITSLVNGVYAFGFLFMLPQLFVNYKLKSVAHLPWRAFMYKAFNTFIDDVFAFIITMPTAHRVACFRDDIVFLVYLYQRWLYPVDKTRVNEYGESFEAEEESKKEK